MFVDQQRPLERRILDVGLRHKVGVESNDDYTRLQRVKSVLVLTQLRQVLAAGQSA